MNARKYIPDLVRGSRVRLAAPWHHPKRDQQCTILDPLPNPSQQAEHQWYDVRFDDGSIGRFLQKHLVAVIAPLTTHCAADLSKVPRGTIHQEEPRVVILKKRRTC